jgi:hypothetical protein
LPTGNAEKDHEMTRTKKILATAAAFGTLAVAAGGSAFTASNGDFSNKAAGVLGYSKVTVSGANVTAIAYVLNADKDNVDGIDFTLGTALPATFIAKVQTAGAGAWTTCEVNVARTAINCGINEVTTPAALVLPVANVAQLALSVTAP